MRPADLAVANLEGTPPHAISTIWQRRKRQDFYLDLSAYDIVLDGWSPPFRTDTEGGRTMAGNACYNLVGDSDSANVLGGLQIASFFTEGGVVRTEILLKMGKVAAKVNKSEATKST